MAISTLTTDSLGEYLTARSVYHLKEGDPHSFAIPRLTGRAKSALVEIQADEYGGGSAERMHSALFAGMMRDLGLDAGDGAVGRRPGGRLFVGEHHVAVRPAPPLAVPALPLAR
jgi:Iron-containing redox enzyme